MARQRIHSSKSVSNKEYCKERKKEKGKNKLVKSMYIPKNIKNV